MPLVWLFSGILTARLQKQRYIQEDFISVALIVFGMAVLAETVTALQFSFWRSGAEARAVQNLLKFGHTTSKSPSVLLSLVASGHPWFITPQSLVG